MKFGKPPYYSDKKIISPTVLERFISPYPFGSLPDMLSFEGIKEGWILDPIGNQPYSAIDLAQTGFNVLVACNNPILAKILQVLCAGYPISEFSAAIADLGTLRRGQERLETQIKDLYRSPCPECFSENTKVKFLWKKNQTTPFAREIECLDCGFNGVVKISEKDLINLNKIGNHQLHRTRVTQRVLPGNSNVPLAVQDVINSYSPRSLSVISTLINKLDSLNTTKDRKNIIESLLIHVFDQGNMLWGINAGRSRPKQISIPNEFYEFNLWEVLEDAVSKLKILDARIPFSIYPEIPQTKGSICFYQGRIHSLKFDAQLPEFDAIATVLPRPNQALWTYNAVWSGWLWGHEIAQKLKGALERRRYDWMWHTQAIRKVFEYTNSLNIPFLAVAPELTNSYILSYFSAAASSNYQLQQAAYQPEEKSGQFYWFRNQRPSTHQEINYRSDALTKFLELKSEPVNYQDLLSIYLVSEAMDNHDTFVADQLEPSLFMETQNQFEKLIQNTELFQQVDEDKLENAEFWLSKAPLQYSPISDQIEGLFIRFVQKNQEFTSEQVIYSINQNLPGLLPASHILIHRLMSSYCESILNTPGKWQLKQHEDVSERKTDLKEMAELVHNIGNKIGYQVSGQNPIEWSSENQKSTYRFFLTASSIISQFSIPVGKFEPVVIFPGSRAEILSYKIKNDPIYARHFRKFHFVKFRHLRTINEISNLDLTRWNQMLDSDPAVWQESNQPGLF